MGVQKRKDRDFFIFPTRKRERQCFISTWTEQVCASFVVIEDERQFVILTEEDVSVLLPLKGRDTVSFSLFISVYQFFCQCKFCCQRQFCCQCQFCCQRRGETIFLFEGVSLLLPVQVLLLMAVCCHWRGETIFHSHCLSVCISFVANVSFVANASFFVSEEERQFFSLRRACHFCCQCKFCC